MSNFAYRGITKVSEGSEKREEDIPIVIRADGVLEWLQERNVFSRNWMAASASCRKTLKVADYLAALDRMEELLRTTSDKSRGLFGGFNDEKLSECEGVLASYTKGRICVAYSLLFSTILFFLPGAVHLAEMASSLTQIVKYESPNERKTMDKLQRSLADVERLEAVVEEEIVSLTKQYERQCLEIGIRPTGKDPLRDLEGLGASMGPWCDRIVEAARATSVKAAIEYFESFALYTEKLIGAPSEPGRRSRFALLHTLISRGNVMRSELDETVKFFLFSSFLGFSLKT